MGFADSNGILTGLLAQPAALAPGQSPDLGSNRDVKEYARGVASLIAHDGAAAPVSGRLIHRRRKARRMPWLPGGLRGFEPEPKPDGAT